MQKKIEKDKKMTDNMKEWTWKENNTADRKKSIAIGIYNTMNNKRNTYLLLKLAIK